MQQRTIELVQQTWKDVEAIAPQAAALFYQNLFSADPDIQPLFRGNMEAQGKKLMQMIGAAVRQLNNPAALVPVLQSLGKRHVDYGVENAHYQSVGAALLKTLAQGLGEAFSADVEQAWAEAYGEMSAVMIEAAGT